MQKFQMLFPKKDSRDEFTFTAKGKTKDGLEGLSFQIKAWRGENIFPNISQEIENAKFVWKRGKLFPISFTIPYKETMAVWEKRIQLFLWA